MIYVVYIVSFILYSWFLFKVGKKNAESKDTIKKDTIKLVITGKPEQVKKAIETINEQNLIK